MEFMNNKLSSFLGLDQTNNICKLRKNFQIQEIKVALHQHNLMSNEPNPNFFSFLGPNYVDSSLIFQDGLFEDVSKDKKAICWKYFLLDKANHKAKCRAKISEGEYCDRVLTAKGGTTSPLNSHLKNQHGINK